MTRKKLKPHEKVILDVLWELPPKELIANPTFDQKTHLEEIEEKFKVLHSFFNAYFSGEPIPIELLEKGNDRDFYHAKFDYFLALYELIQCGWKYLEKSSKILFETPGDCFIQILKNHAEAQVHKCTLGRYDERPRYLNDMRRLEHKIEKGTLKEGQPGKRQKEKYERHIKNLVNLGFYKFAELEILCVSICKKNSKGNKWLKKKFEKYSTESQTVKEVSKRIDRNRNAYAWQKREKLHSVREGGSYAQ